MLCNHFAAFKQELSAIFSLQHVYSSLAFLLMAAQLLYTKYNSFKRSNLFWLPNVASQCRRILAFWILHIAKRRCNKLNDWICDWQLVQSHLLAFNFNETLRAGLRSITHHRMVETYCCVAIGDVESQDTRRGVLPRMMPEMHVKNHYVHPQEFLPIDNLNK